MPERCLTFGCSGDTLVGVLHEPESACHDLGILIVVGGPQYRAGSHRQFVLMARRLAEAGYPVLRFDYRGMGDSTGDARSFDSVDSDVRAAIDALSVELPSLAGVCIFGLCDAASAALLYCRSDARVRSLVLANPWVRTPVGEARARIRHYYLFRAMQRSFWRKAFSGSVNLRHSLGAFLSYLGLARRGNRSENPAAGAEFVRDMQRGLAGFSGPVLILLSERDLVAREFTDLVASSTHWRTAVGKVNVRQFPLPGADHTFSAGTSLDLAVAAMLQWLRDAEAKPS